MARYVAEQADEGGFKPPEEGKYTATVLDCAEKVSSKGNPMFEFWLSVTASEGEHKFHEWVTFSPKSMWRVAEMLHAFGKSTREDADIDPTTLIGKTCEIKVKHETRDKYTNLRIEEWVSAIDDEEPKRPKMSPKQKHAVQRAVQQRKERLDEVDDLDSDEVPF